MKKIFAGLFLLFVLSSVVAFAQNPIETQRLISKAEDELRFDKTLEDLMKDGSAPLRRRAALAAGRIGDVRAVSALVSLLENDKDLNVRATSAFALGEIESIDAADAILKILKDGKQPNEIRARAVEAAGKIAAANVKNDVSKVLGIAVLELLEFENTLGKSQNSQVILLGITAVLRAKPAEGENTVKLFLANTDSRIRADAANTLSRLRSKIANAELNKMLVSDNDPIARANAARALGAAEDKSAFNALLGAAVADSDLRVRVSAIRSLGSLKDINAVGKLLDRSRQLLANYKKSKFANPVEKNEILEIASALGKILEKSNDEKAIKFLTDFDVLDKYRSPEISVALIHIKPLTAISESKKKALKSDWRVLSSVSQSIREIPDLVEKSNNEKFRVEIKKELLSMIDDALKPENEGMLSKPKMSPAIPDLIRSYAAFKPENISPLLRQFLTSKDLFIRSTAADILSEQPSTAENISALEKAFAESLKTDKVYNDAQLSILTSLVKLDRIEAVPSIKLALNAPDYLVRRHAAELIKQNDLTEEIPNAADQVGTVKTYNPQTGTKLGQVINTEADYLRSVSRKNAKAVITTEKGKFIIELLPEDAPLTVDNFIKLANSNYFNGVEIHRVVANFVVQDGDPRGDGNGGPGWSIRDELNTVPYERGAVGMALSGKNTGGSQWFMTHSPQPHLDGGYTVFGKVNESGMKIVDNLVRGDKILKVEIVEGKSSGKIKK